MVIQLYLQFSDKIGCVDAKLCDDYCKIPNGCSNVVYPTLVKNLLPPVARGVMLVVMLAALMSSLTSIFNSSSTLFTMDIWKRIRPLARDWELMMVGRFFVLVLVGVSIAWIPIIESTPSKYLKFN